jgi:membrane protein implicated in regulation of membrane protease activity
MRLRGPLVAGTILSLAVIAAWAWMSALTIGPAGPLHPTWRHPVASYMALAEAPTGNGWELFAVVAFIYAVCFLVAGWRYARRRASATSREDLSRYDNA